MTQKRRATTATAFLAALAWPAITFVSSSQEPILGTVPQVRLSYLAQRTMLGDSSFHNFESAGTSAGVRGEASVNSGGKRIGVLWSISASPNASVEELLDGPVDSDYVHYATSFPLTSVGFRGDGKLLVAGADRITGRAMIELWEFKQPSVSAESKLTAGEISSREVIFSAPASPDFGHVTWMMGGGALPDDEVLLMTYPDHTVYRFDSSEALAVPLMSPTQVTGALEPVVELASWWDEVFYEGQHVKFGHCYHLRKSGKVDPSDFAIRAVMLYDQDLDGSPDGALVLPDRDAYEEHGLTVQANWL